MPEELLDPSVEPEPTVPPRRLSSDLRGLLEQASGHSVTIEALEGWLQGRGFAMFILLLAAPFIVPTPGLSVPFGIAISILGLRLLFGRKPSLPGFILRREVKFKVLSSIITRLIPILERFEKRVKPRLHGFYNKPGAMNLIGLGIFSGGAILSLPLPIPFSNGLPAISIMLLAAGMMERDGLLILWGHLSAIASWIYLGICWQAVVITIEKVSHWWPHTG